MKRSSPVSLIFLLVAWGNLSDGFVTNFRNRHGSIRAMMPQEFMTVRLEMSSVDSTVTAAAAATTTTAMTTELIPMDLPKNALPFREEAKYREALLGLEVMIGRVAMIAALFFFAVEVATNKSIPAQIEQLVDVAMLS